MDWDTLTAHGTSSVDGASNSNVACQPAPFIFDHKAFSGCGWTDSTKTITGSGFTAFTNSIHFVRVLSGTGVTLGVYRATTSTGTTIVLESDINGGGGNISDASISIVQYDPIHLHALSYGNAMQVAISRVLEEAHSLEARVRAVSQRTP